MLESLYISKSKIRRDLLSLFFTNPSQRYYLRELERLLGYSAGSIRRELRKFQKDRLFVTEKVGNLLYYSLNTKHPLFKELKGIVSKTVGVEGSLKKALAPLKGVEIAFVFGSYAAGRESSASDIDLMIIGDPDSSAVNRKLSMLERRLNREINVSLHSREDYLARKKSGSGFIRELLKKPRIMIVGSEDDL